jgi:very-short-patch-repair endonuclease
MAKHKDRALDWITRWRQAAPTEVKRELAQRNMLPRHQEHPDGEAKVVADRRYRFDWAVPQLRVAVEIDGGNYQIRWSKKQRRHVPVGRHTKPSDYEKRNLATAEGWALFAYTTQMLRENPAACVEQVANYILERLNELPR